jgi:hypothetical protein
MNIGIDIKSAVIGLAAGALITLGIAATTSPGTPVGRYQLVSNVNNGGQGGSFSMILDTQSGKVWSAYSLPTGTSDAEFFQPKEGGR